MQVRTKREWIAGLIATAVLLLGMVPIMYLWMYLSQFVWARGRSAKTCCSTIGQFTWCWRSVCLGL